MKKKSSQNFKLITKYNIKKKLSKTNNWCEIHTSCLLHFKYMRAYVDIVYIMCVWYAVKYMRYMYIYMKSKIPYIHVYVMSAKKLQDLNHERRKWNDHCQFVKCSATEILDSTFKFPAPKFKWTAWILKSVIFFWSMKDGPQLFLAILSQGFCIGA